MSQTNCEHQPCRILFAERLVSLQVIVLSPDAQLELEEVVEGHTYVIGGLVDRTVHKNQTLFYAADHGYQVQVYLVLWTPCAMYRFCNVTCICIPHVVLCRGPPLARLLQPLTKSCDQRFGERQVSACDR